MTEADLLERTRDLVAKSGLPKGLGLGDLWAIALGASPSLPPSAEERLEAAHADYHARWPEDVHVLTNTRWGKTSRFLLLRAGSPALDHWLREGAAGGAHG